MARSCPFGQSYEPLTGNCVCQKPKVWILGQCKMPDPCRANEYWCGTSCVCMNGFFRINGMCMPVPTPRSCPANSVSNGVNCQCIDGYYPIQPGTCSQCPPGTYWNGQECAEGDFACLPGYKWDSVVGGCVLAIPLCNPN